MAKRYVLYEGVSELSGEDIKELTRILETRHGDLKTIPLKDSPRAFVVKTTGEVASRLRAESGLLRLGDKEVVAVLTFGAIGKLKKRAARRDTTGDVKVPER